MVIVGSLSHILRVMDDEPLERAMPLSEAVNYFPASVKWLREKCRKNEIEHYKIGREYAMTPSQIRAAQEQFVVRAEAPEPQYRINTRQRPRSYKHLRE